MSADTMVHAMKQAAADHFPYKERRAHTPWIKDHTLQLLAQARAAQADGHEDWKTQRNKAKRAARRDRIDWVHDQLLADPDARITSRVRNGLRPTFLTTPPLDVELDRDYVHNSLMKDGSLWTTFNGPFKKVKAERLRDRTR
ncbi:Pol [Symbiodinium natans]|uniref:Pol protein n=1 Tax=Symbiodinium natans TaxID=878477 RepID=A0A812Q0P3_9DINO|nr:Pol [Symbiodinium natans]